MSEYQVIEKEEGLQFLEEMFESTELKVTESYNYPTIMEDLSNVVLYHIKEVTFEGEEKSPRREAFENVIGMIQNEGVNFIYLILGDKKGVSFYFGLVKESKYNGELPMPIDEMGNNLLKSAIRGNFRGSKIEEVSPEEMVEIFDKMNTNANNRSKKYASVIGTPGINESEDKKSFQGVDRLVDVMQGDDFGLCILAKPLSKKAIKKIEDDLYRIYESLSTFSKISLQEGKNISEGTSTSKGTSDSVSTGENKTTGTNYSKTSGTSENKGASESKTAGSTKSTNYSESQTEGKSRGKTEGSNKGSSVTKGKNEGSTSGSSSNSTNKGTNESGTESKGTSYSENEGSSSSKGTNAGYSNSENMSKTKGTNTSIGSSQSKTAGTSETTGTSTTSTTGTNSSVGESTTTGSSQNVSKDIINKKAADYVKYIDEMLLPIIDYGKSKGLYLTTTFIFADKNSQLEKLGNTIKSLYSGKKGNKNPLEFEILDNNDKKVEYFKNFQIPDCVSYDNENALTLKSYFIENGDVSLGNWYSPNELGLIAGLPEKEVVGLALNEEVEFGLNAKTPDKNEELISLGNLVQSGNEIDTKVYLEKSALNKHIFITGVTGTGKTTTCQKLLLESELPFLVIEPAKTEYRILMNNEKTKDILIFTLGNDKVAPFRLNPFEFFEGESITSRVDMLKAAMEASFDMEAAIPQIIESAMYSCYEDYGWNIDTDENDKFDNPFDEGVYSFPTLEDLLNKVETEVTKHNFDDRLKKDYIGSITARLQGLLVGSKGQMLNARRSIDFRELIEKKVVLEIEGIKNGTEKSLIMGFILTNLCEALKAKYNKDKHFKHITLIEEAHRLLSKYTPGDSLNKKNSVETFADMLAEVRKYGESLIIADQIPNKMTPEVLKNTNTKIVHKIFAEDDKEAIGNTISLSKEQKDFLASLPTGRAIVFSQSWTKAIQVQIEQMTDTTSDEIIDEDRLRDRVEDFYVENYKKGIFIGTKYEKISKEQFRLCRKFSTNKEFVKIFKAVFEENVNSFSEFEKVSENLNKLLKDKKFLEDIEKILRKNERDIESIEKTQENFKNYYENIFQEDIYGIIYFKYYENYRENEIKQNNIKDGIKEVFNGGNFNLKDGGSLIQMYRTELKEELKK
ncbi:helicase HerA domain-containing protein [Fusobacterium animalis]|uniref:helicase HerA domain-containing protein n=1 Tax=Fusobacterium animalis TaxID=76859 RepID=UPI0030CF25F1